jgi:tRNA(Ile2) C34 agmatinyltransferase TiaS
MTKVCKCGAMMNLWFDKIYRCPNCGRKEGGENKNDNNKRQEGDHGVVK